MQVGIFYKKSDLPERKRIFWEPLGISYLASYLRKNGYSVDMLYPLIEDMEEEDVKQWLAEKVNDYSLVGLSTSDFAITGITKYVSILKDCNFSGKIVVGGLGPTCNWKEFVLTGADAVVIGEGEKTLLKIANSIKKNKPITNVEGIAYIKDNRPFRNGLVELIEKLDDNVFPARDISVKFLTQFDVNQIHIQIQTSRGCFGNCSFCSISNFLREQGGVRYRERSAQSVVQEIIYLNSTYGFRKFDFMDENFFPLSQKSAVEKCANLVQELRENKCDIELFVQCHLQAVSIELLNLLKSINVTSIFVGIDSFQSNELRLFNKSYTKEHVMSFLNMIENSSYSFDVDSKFRIKTGFINFTPISSLDMLYENGLIFKKYSFSCKKLIRKLKVNAGNSLLLERIYDVFADFSNDNYFMYSKTEEFYVSLVAFFEIYEAIRGNLRNIENIYLNDANTIQTQVINRITEMREKTDNLFFDFYFSKLLEIKESINDNSSEHIKKLKRIGIKADVLLNQLSDINNFIKYPINDRGV